jgi:hypothetical protein
MWKIFSTFFLIFLCANNSFADLPFKKFSYFSNYGGLNDSLASTAIADNEATSIQNIVFDTAGAISKRYGYQNITPTTGNVYQIGLGNNAVTGLTYYVNNTTGNKYLVAIANVSGQATGYEKQLDSSNNIPVGPWTSIGSSLLPSNYTNDEQPNFTIDNNQLIITFPAFQGWQPLAWQATANIYAFSNSANNVVNATMCAYFNNILFLAGDPNNKTRVSFSNLSGAVNNFVVTDFFDIDKNNGHFITALVPAFGNLYIFEDNSIWMLTGSSRDTFAVQKMVDNVGTLSPHSVFVVNNDIYFITKQNDIALYDGTFTVKYLSSKIRNTIGSNNFNRASEALGIGFSSYKYKDLDYYVSESTSGSGTNNQVLVFDTDKEAWTKFNNINPDSWTVIPSSTGQDILVFGDYNGLVYYYPNIGTYNDVSNACTGGACTATSPSIYALYQTKWFTFPDASLGDKYVRVLKTYIQNSTLSSTLTTNVNYDYVSPGITFTYTFNPMGSLWGSALWGSSFWESTQSLNIDREEPNVGKQMFQIQYSNNTASQDMTVLGYEVFVEPTSQL